LTSARVQAFLARRETALAVTLIAAYLVVYGTLAILRHRTFHSFGFDLALFDQVFWNTTQGRLFESTISQADPRPHSYLGDHWSPVYGLLAPFYRAYPHPETLLVIQTLLLGLGALPIYLLARLKLEPGFQRLACVLAYFLFLPVGYISLLDFHDVALSVLPLGLALYFLETERHWWFLVCLAVTFLIKEEMPLIAVGFGAYALLGKRLVPLGLGVIAVSLVTFLVLLQIAIPHYAGGAAYPYLAGRYGALGSTPLQIIQTVVSNPLKVAHVLFQFKKLAFVVGLFGPVLGLTALARWAGVLVLPTLGYLLLSGYQPEYSFATQYPVPLVALILGTSILALARLPAGWRSPAAAAMIVSSLVFSFLFGDLPFSRHFDTSRFTVEPRVAAFSAAIDQIGSDASVAAQDGFASHLSERRRIYSLSYEGVSGAEYVVLDYAADHRSLAAHLARVAEVKSMGYDEVASGPGLAILKRRPQAGLLLRSAARRGAMTRPHQAEERPELEA
jgi:uncharacterized membrane protein